MARALLVFKSLTVARRIARLECAYGEEDIGGQVEVYTLRGYPRPTGNSWAVTEIRLFDFVVI
jgi:hypothetical protein